MANTLTAVASVLYAAARITPREMTGYLGAVNRDFDDKNVAQGEVVKVPVVPAMTATTVPAPGMTFAAGTDRTPTTIDMTLGQSVQLSWNLTAEQERGLTNSGVAQEFLRQTVEQAIRAAVNQMESYLGTICKNAASRSIGVSGTTPFASNFDLLADAKKILKDNGAPDLDRSAVIDTSAEANLSKLSALYKVNEAGTADNLRNGVLGRLQGFDLRTSAGIASHTKGTGASYVIDGTGNTAVGSTVLKLKTGTGTVLAGDAITIGSFTYVVKTALTGGLVTIQEPGLRAAVADGDTVTLAANYAGNIALSRSAVAMAMRPILQPAASNIEQMTIADEQTGASFLLMRTVGDQMASWYLRAVYDAVAVNPYAIVSIRG